MRFEAIADQLAHNIAHPPSEQTGAAEIKK